MFGFMIIQVTKLLYFCCSNRVDVSSRNSYEENNFHERRWISPTDISEILQRNRLDSFLGFVSR